MIICCSACFIGLEAVLAYYFGLYYFNNPDIDQIAKVSGVKYKPSQYSCWAAPTLTTQGPWETLALAEAATGLSSDNF